MNDDRINEVPIETIRQYRPETFRGRLQELNKEFARLNEKLMTPLAREIKKMRENCKHVNSEARPHARFCNDCSEYYAVDTSFSLEVEQWFTELNRRENDRSPMVIAKVPE